MEGSPSASQATEAPTSTVRRSISSRDSQTPTTKVCSGTLLLPTQPWLTRLMCPPLLPVQPPLLQSRTRVRHQLNLGAGGAAAVDTLQAVAALLAGPMGHVAPFTEAHCYFVHLESLLQRAKVGWHHCCMLTPIATEFAEEAKVGGSCQSACYPG